LNYSAEPLDESPAAFLTHHVVVPAAVIAMVASFLSYLVDVRSAYLGGGPHLRWIGFCFVMATVLIERHGRSMADAGLQGCYTWALAGATVAVMLIAPWESESGHPGEKLANLLIIGVVWRFATRVTRELSPEAGRQVRRPDERKAPSIWNGAWAVETKSQPPPPSEPAARPRNPAATVARLAAVALLAFALGEPVLLAAVPQTGVKALAAIVIFLFSTGIVLAAGSALDMLRRIQGAGVFVSPGLVPGRVALAAVLLAVVLASALAVPGLEFQGTGRLKPPPVLGKGEEQNRGNQETLDPGQPSFNIPQGDLGNDPGGSSGPTNASSPGSTSQDPFQRLPKRTPQAASLGPAGGMVAMLASIGKWLLIPLILALVAAGIWGLVRLWPLLKGWRSKATDRWRTLLNRLSSLLGRLPRPGRRDRSGADPMTGLDGLLERPSREAILAAYQRFLLLLERLGHTRPEKATPYEILTGLPPHLKLLEPPARTLTNLYVLAAYAAETVEPGARERSITALKEIRGLVPQVDITKGALP
jgi:hypothetical protein